MNKKTKLFILVGVVVLIILLAIKVSGPKTPNEKVTKYFVNKLGFSNTDGSNLYSKQNSKIDFEEYERRVGNNLDSEYEIVYFNSDNYQLTMSNITYSNGITKDFTPVYSYSDNKITYIYRIKYNTANAIVEGSFDAKSGEFVCKPTFAYNIDIKNGQVDVCNKVKVVVEDFDYYARTLINNPEILKDMQKK